MKTRKSHNLKPSPPQLFQDIVYWYSWGWNLLCPTPKPSDQWLEQTTIPYFVHQYHQSISNIISTTKIYYLCLKYYDHHSYQFQMEGSLSQAFCAKDITHRNVTKSRLSFVFRVRKPFIGQNKKSLLEGLETKTTSSLGSLYQHSVELILTLLLCGHD